MRRLAFAPLALAALLGPTLGSTAARAGEATDDRVLVYVDEVKVGDKSLAGDATALTTALCAAIGKDKRVDVLCAPDVKQILSFAATAAMIGNSGGPSGALQERLERTRHVVSAAYRKEGGNFILVVKAGPKAAEAAGTALFSDKPVIALEEKGDHQRKLLDKLPAVAGRVTAALSAAEGVVPAPSAPPPPPAPLQAATKGEAKGGW